VGQAVVDEKELGGEQQARHQAGTERAVTVEQRQRTHARPRQQQRRCDDGADPALHHRGDIRKCHLHRDLLQPPQQAAADHQRIRAGIKRQAGRRVQRGAIAAGLRFFHSAPPPEIYT
jgi:hypothetical protein